MTQNGVLAQDFLENERFPERFPAVSYGFPEVSAVSGNFPFAFLNAPKAKTLVSPQTFSPISCYAPRNQRFDGALA